uniref:L27-1 domain-containing protein n=1 Tax=Chelydra serpentina TaxID=8475 RepID=A0A8C3SNH5_CHESE
CPVNQQYTQRAVAILTRYQTTLRAPEEQQLKASIGKVSHIFRSDLFQALLGKRLPPSELSAGFALNSH